MSNIKAFKSSTDEHLKRIAELNQHIETVGTFNLSAGTSVDTALTELRNRERELKQIKRTVNQELETLKLSANAAIAEIKDSKWDRKRKAKARGSVNQMHDTVKVEYGHITTEIGRLIAQIANAKSAIKRSS